MKQLKLHSQNMKSITAAIQAAGGSVDVLLSKEVLSFLETLAQNGVSLNAKFHQEPIVDGWIINTQTTEDPPSGLKYYDEIEIVYDDGQQTTLFVDYVVRFYWNTSYGKHIAKYRKVNK